MVSDRCGVGNGPLLVRPSSLKRTLSSPLLSPPRPGHASLYAFPEDAEAPAVQLVSTRRSGLKRLVEVRREPSACTRGARPRAPCQAAA